MPVDSVALIREALRLSDLGYHVHPIARKGITYRDRHGVERVTNGKAPITAGWQTRTLSQRDLLRELRKPTVSGLGFRADAERTVLDFDGEGWRGALEYVLSEYGELEEAPRVLTGSGRVHLHFTCDGMVEAFTNQKFSRPDLKAVIELRGHRSNCVLPPTIHPETGRTYTWVIDPEFTELPRIAFARIDSWLSDWSGVEKSAEECVKDINSTTSLPIGNFAYNFIERGWELGCPGGISQRHAILRVARNLLSTGSSVEETFNSVWIGIQLSPWDRAKGPWTREEIRGIVEDLARRPAPPLKPRVLHDPRAIIHRGGLRVVRVERGAQRKLPREVVPCRS